MIAAKKSDKTSNIASRIRKIQASWSTSQRTDRLIDGDRRRTEFDRLIAVPPPQVEIWAAGALDATDLQRMAGGMGSETCT
jgi:hypothetical protein